MREQSALHSSRDSTLTPWARYPASVEPVKTTGPHRQPAREAHRRYKDKVHSICIQVDA